MAKAEKSSPRLPKLDSQDPLASDSPTLFAEKSRHENTTTAPYDDSIRWAIYSLEKALTDLTKSVERLIDSFEFVDRLVDELETLGKKVDNLTQKIESNQQEL